MLPLDVLADGSELLVVDMHGSPFHGKFWSLPVVGGEPRRLGDTEGRAAAWSPNGKFLAYSSGSDFFVAQADGSEPRKLATTKVFAEVNSLTWSPDAAHLRVQALEAYGKPMVLWEVPMEGGEIHPLVPGGASLHDDFQCCGSWTADGRYFVFASRGQIWALPRKGNRFHPNPDPIQLTSSPMWLATPVPSKDGKKLFVNGSTSRGELLRYEAGSGQFVPFLGGISAEYMDFSRDGQWAAYVSYPEGTLWRSKVDGSERLQLAAAREFLAMPRWSPDGKQVAYFAVTAGKPARIYEVSSEGGTPQQLVPDDPAQQFDPNWSPEGNKIVFGGASNDPASTIRILDLATRQVSTLPASQGFYSPRWSPDGRYIVALTGDSTGMELFDFQTGKWTELAKGTLGSFPNWSKDGRYVYALALSTPGKVLRVRIADRKIEEVADMKTLTSTGSLALAPDDSILLLRDIGTEDIYSLDWEAP
jgi:Tol biopolymer transport system component